MGFAVNASTMGMAVAGLVVGFLSPHIDRRLGILVSLVLLAIPTALLASAPDLTVFTRPDGQRQSAYKGHPMYFFVGDATAGDTNGRGVNNRDTVDPRNVP